MSEEINNKKKVALSARAIDKMKIGDPDKSDIGEYSGLRVTCGKTGLKSFVYRYRSPIDNSLKKITLGNYPHMSLAEARIELQRLKLLRSQGVCPATQRKEEKLTLKKNKEDSTAITIKTLTLKDVIDLYLNEVIEDRVITDQRTGTKKIIQGSRTLKGQQEARRTLYVDAVAKLGDRPADGLIRKDIVEFIKGIIDRGAQVQAGRVLSELVAAYDYAIGLDYFPENFANPALLAKSSLKQTRIKLTCNKRTRVLSDSELKHLLFWLPVSGFSKHHKSILMLALWTGARTGEICSAEWKDINFEKATWHLRGTKNGTERFVQLSKQCIEHLKKLPSFNSQYLFPSFRTGKPIAQKTITEAKWVLRGENRAKNYNFQPHQLWPKDMEDWNPHDLRRTLRTNLSRLGCPTDVAEAVLGHSKKGIEGTYNLHTYEKECAIWLQRWADYLDSLIG
ncbi:TPA: tyrosine-type recombinase/integrase [Acinetobacter baumannii]|uniref:tyrosine-type recombinase/integrase n=1 Tax=Acinetobacter baumannii TaxID=470 RepID=UPI0023419ADF|nr:tyrosine-type recombinase/integrase [Acinetobacter baumannii]MDC4493714.1 tyrosine-type recombinase/integrase [Acinetobacter baumannii]MDC4872239.1 tyrosine-type recombinase/integrase [Acinetobacter baumannii]MDC4883484.1 tyrosine-type recombinase/integrase [Acinetobacter baumannii]MDC4890686.1 tyrosine-type recombinase/integrase [Acinetobacter baumannii]